MNASETLKLVSFAQMNFKKRKRRTNIFLHLSSPEHTPALVPASKA